MARKTKRCDYCGERFTPYRRTQRFCPAPRKCRIYGWRKKESTVAGTQMKHLKALIRADVRPAVLLKVAQVNVRQVADAAGVSYTLAWRVANNPLSWKSQADGTNRVRRAIMEALEMPELWDLED